MEEAAAAAVTIYADASILHQIGAGSWGAVIRGGGPDIELGGAFRHAISCSTTGEAQAMANALHTAIAHQRIRRGTEVLLVNDNQATILMLQGACGEKTLRKTRRANPACAAALDEVHRIVRDCGATVSFHWVRGHQKLTSPDPHADGNRRADKLAKENWGPEAVALRKKRKAARLAKRKAKRLNQQKVDA